LLNSGITT
jgi:hypothetical protein